VGVKNLAFSKKKRKKRETLLNYYFSGKSRAFATRGSKEL